jgi:hypothetical protein
MDLELYGISYADAHPDISKKGLSRLVSAAAAAVCCRYYAISMTLDVKL